MSLQIPNVVDVIVVGFGFAGGSAALAAARRGSSVLVLEKAAHPGGISICAAGGVRIANDARAALRYLEATCGGKTPTSVLKPLAEGMVRLPDIITGLAAGSGAKVARRGSPGHYPFPGQDTFGFINVDEVPGFDPETEYPHVRAAGGGMRLFKLLSDAVKREARIQVVTNCAVERLHRDADGIHAVGIAGNRIIAARQGVILACGGFEANVEMQRQFWAGGAALNAAYGHNTGDGIRMAQSVGADLWHMWHYHGSYGFAPPADGYPYGVRVKRLPDWRPNEKRSMPKLAWILMGRNGARFMNEYEPYAQDTGWRPLSVFDPMTQGYPRNPAYLVTDSAGMAMYPLGKPTRNDPQVNYDWSDDNAREIGSGVFHRADSPRELAALLGIAPDSFEATLKRWNAFCDDDRDPDHGRPSGSLHPLRAPPYYAAEVRPIVSNTQGGPVRNSEQRIVDVFGQPIPRLYSAGELGSAFGHLYLAGGNLAECFIGGEIAGTNAAAEARRVGALR
jgi:succinate dehydrogenase/fumarate reductase flavoprotein subunit